MNRDFSELLRLLAEAEVRFLIVGAYAVAIHGRPRATGDLDIWVEPTRENAERVWGVLLEFGAPLDVLTVDDLAVPGTVYQMGRAPNRVDIITRASGLEFSRAFEHRIEARFGDRLCPVVGFDDLIANKQATGRNKDLGDVEDLLRINRKR